MISDVLADAEHKIGSYLRAYPTVYDEELSRDIGKLLEHMRRVRMMPGMDMPPLRTNAEPAKRNVG